MSEVKPCGVKNCGQPATRGVRDWDLDGDCPCDLAVCEHHLAEYLIKKIEERDWGIIPLEDVFEG